MTMVTKDVRENRGLVATMMENVARSAIERNGKAVSEEGKRRDKKIKSKTYERREYEGGERAGDRSLEAHRYGLGRW